jgi:CheY-like chemotaxis protein
VLPLAVLHDADADAAFAGAEGDAGPGAAGGPRPARAHPGAAGSPGADPCPIPELAGLTVLVVDDEPDARELVRRFLTDCRATVVTAGSAAEALAVLADLRPDVIVSDVGMPDADGYDLIRAVRNSSDPSGRRTPAVALTAFARSEDRTRAMLAGFNAHLSKPIEPVELAADGRQPCRPHRRAAVTRRRPRRALPTRRPRRGCYRRFRLPRPRGGSFARSASRSACSFASSSVVTGA